MQGSKGDTDIKNRNLDIVRDGHGEGNGTPLQYSCLENSMDGEAWWAAVHGVTQSWTQLKRLSSSSSSVPGLFSSHGEQGLLSSCGARASH